MRITQKKTGKRARIQFYLTDELDQLLSQNRALATRINRRIDFQESFRVWFLKECKEANAALAKLVKDPKDNGNP